MTLGIKIYHVQDFIRKNESGYIDRARSIAIVRDVCTAASFHVDSNMLVDLRETTVSDASFADVARVAEEFIRLQPDFRNKIAVVIPDDPERIVRARELEIAMISNHVKYRIFTDYERAIDWLSDIKTLRDRHGAG
jgi:hypothetical protein